MNELVALLGLVILFLTVFRVSVWVNGIDRAARIFAGEKKVTNTGYCGVLYINGGSRDGWVRLLYWRFSIENGRLNINPIPQIPMVWLLPSLAIPLSELVAINTPAAWFSGGWRKAFLVEKAEIQLRLPKPIAEQVCAALAVTADPI